jgi:hypothetical protein
MQAWRIRGNLPGKKLGTYPLHGLVFKVLKQSSKLPQHLSNDGQ